uniref:Uncharacterized protein n=1 Tax=Caenorhabditis japonica TaxID=281687 RepID=A0A8R1DHL3_CAEJA
MSFSSSASQSGSESIPGVEASEVVGTQVNLAVDLIDLLNDYMEKHQNVVDHGEEVLNEYHETKNQVADDFDVFMHKIHKKLNVKQSEKNAGMNAKVEKFEKGVREIVDLYTEVNEKMKEGERLIVQQDSIIHQYERNNTAFKNLKRKMQNLKIQFAPKIPPIPSSSSLCQSSATDTLIQANLIKKPFKAVETEISTYIIRIVEDLHQLREHLQLCSNVKTLTEPVIQQSKLVASMILKEIPAKPLPSFLDTLPTSQRDG